MLPLPILQVASNNLSLLPSAEIKIEGINNILLILKWGLPNARLIRHVISLLVCLIPKVHNKAPVYPFNLKICPSKYQKSPISQPNSAYFCSRVWHSEVQNAPLVALDVINFN